MNIGKSRRGFILYLAFLVTTVLFVLVIGGQDICRNALDIGRSNALEVIAIQAADGGLERALGMLKATKNRDSFSYKESLGSAREVLVRVAVSPASQGVFDILSTATVRDGGKLVARHQLERAGVSTKTGRNQTGQFREVL